MTEATFQQRVDVWMHDCFGAEITHDPVERNFRFLEEVLETVQANGFTMDQAHFLVDYVFGRPVGEVHLEAGGAMVTLAALCTAAKVDMVRAAEAELIRIGPMKAQIAAKQRKKPRNPPLSGGGIGTDDIDPQSYLGLQTAVAAGNVLARFGLTTGSSSVSAFNRLSECADFQWFLWREAIAAAREPVSVADLAEGSAITGSFASLLARFGRLGQTAPNFGVASIDPIASGVHGYWRGIASKSDWNSLKTDMPGQVALFRAMADRVTTSGQMATWKTIDYPTIPDEAITALAAALYESWNRTPPAEPWSPALEATYHKKAAAAAASLRSAGIGLAMIERE